MRPLQDCASMWVSKQCSNFKGQYILLFCLFIPRIVNSYKKYYQKMFVCLELCLNCSLFTLTLSRAYTYKNLNSYYGCIKPSKSQSRRKFFLIISLASLITLSLWNKYNQFLITKSLKTWFGRYPIRGEG